ncbi:MAG: SCP2 sterol-binding domain-containing protein [Nitrososphaeria archaeon]|nr:SCP2 sterol-binding domain-containing protein [Nitrososphaeria archaeon]
MIREENLLFLSEEWVKRFVEELNKNQIYLEAAKDWEGDFLFIVDKGPKVESEIVVYLDLWHGKCRDYMILPDRNAKKTEFIFEGSYDNWKKLAKGELDPIKAILMRKFKLSGSMSKLMKNVKAASELAKNCTRVPTKFL